jgi:hypothetical protein
MAENDDLGEVKDIEVDPLTDKDLEGVAGGAAIEEIAVSDSSSCTCGCSSFSCPC